jgi:transcriptional regulator with XRE-family HTH domain
VRITPAECKAARKLLGWSREELATMLLIGQDTIGDFERRERRSPLINLRKLCAVFEAAGVEFTDGAKPKLAAKPAVTRATWDPPPER